AGEIDAHAKPGDFRADAEIGDHAAGFQFDADSPRAGDRALVGDGAHALHQYAVVSANDARGRPLVDDRSAAGADRDAGDATAAAAGISGNRSLIEDCPNPAADADAVLIAGYEGAASEIADAAARVELDAESGRALDRPLIGHRADAVADQDAAVEPVDRSRIDHRVGGPVMQVDAPIAAGDAALIGQRPRAGGANDRVDRWDVDHAGAGDGGGVGRRRHVGQGVEILLAGLIGRDGDVGARRRRQRYTEGDERRHGEEQRRARGTVSQGEAQRRRGVAIGPWSAFTKSLASKTRDVRAVTRRPGQCAPHRQSPSVDPERPLRRPARATTRALLATIASCDVNRSLIKMKEVRRAVKSIASERRWARVGASWVRPR